MTSEAEQRDIDEMKVEIAERQSLFFSMARDIIRMDANGLASIGYRGKTVDEAIAGNVRYVLKEIDQIHAKFYKKWPD